MNDFISYLQNVPICGYILIWFLINILIYKIRVKSNKVSDPFW